jgi:hypothetical protein
MYPAMAATKASVNATAESVAGSLAETLNSMWPSR